MVVIHRLALLATLSALTLGAAASPAVAQDSNAPPGNSAVDQYLETVPGAAGNRPAGPRSDPRVLPAATRTRLGRAGTDGQALANLVASTGPIPARSTAGRRPSHADRAAPVHPAGHPTNTARSLPGVLAAPSVAGAGPGGMGLALPALLLFGAAGVAVAALRRRRAEPRKP